jgi:hypothetical protein
MKTKGKAKVLVHLINDPKKTFKEMKDFPPTKTGSTLSLVRRKPRQKEPPKECKMTSFFVYHEHTHEAATTFVDTTLPGLIKQGTEYSEVRKLEKFREVRRGGHMEHYDAYADRLRSSVTQDSASTDYNRAPPRSSKRSKHGKYAIVFDTTQNFPPLKQKENATTPKRNHWFPKAKEADNVSEVSGTTEAITKTGKTSQSMKSLNNKLNKTRFWNGLKQWKYK